MTCFSLLRLTFRLLHSIKLFLRPNPPLLSLKPALKLREVQKKSPPFRNKQVELYVNRLFVLFCVGQGCF
eukprot:m.64554 g.64554  ORF g.64554 m.64554 type:complete len:70 (+) comp35263_c0_seq1:15004-15213(+)